MKSTDCDWQISWVYIKIHTYLTLEKCNMILTLVKHWLMLDKSMRMCEMPNGIHEMAVTDIVMMNMQEKVFNTYC